MNRKIMLTACVFGALAVICGAFGAHALKARISASDLENWKTAVNYQFYHALALLFLSLFSARVAKVNYIYWAFTAGMVFFSGSLYLLSTRSITGLGVSVLGPVTPLGGLLLIIGWIGLLLAAGRLKDA